MKNKSLLLLVPLLGMSLLTGCSEGSSTTGTFDPFGENKFDLRFSFQTEPNAEGLKANLSLEDPLVYDSTVTLNKYEYNLEEDIPGYVEGGEVTIEDYVRKDVATTWGQGYPITRIGEKCFYRNEDITKVVLPTTTEYIMDQAFSRCTQLADINVASLTNLKYIGDKAFYQSPWYSTYSADIQGPVIFGNVLYSVNGTLDDNYVIPSNITTITDSCFKGHTELKSVTFPAGLKIIGDNAFDGCTGLTSIDIPDSVDTMGADVFAGCTGLTHVNLNKVRIDNRLITKNANLTEITYGGGVGLSKLLGGDSNIVNLNKVTILGSDMEANAFSGATNLETIDFNNTVKVVLEDSFNNLPNLTTLLNTNSIEYIADDSLLESSSKYLTALSDGEIYLGHAFVGFKGEKHSLTLREDTTGVSASAFKDYTYSINIDNNIKYIGNNAFANVASLTEINLPHTVSIGDNAFKDCTNITKIILGDNCVLGENVFKNISKVTELALPYAEKLSTLFGTDLKDTLVSYTFLDGPTEIATRMFSDFTKLKTVKFNNTIETIGTFAFEGCTSLTSLDLPENIGTINNFAFTNCTGLTNVTFNTSLIDGTIYKYKYRGLHNLNNFVFFGCKNLKTSKVNDFAIENTFILPESLNYVYSCSFMDTSIEKINLRVPSYYFDGNVAYIGIRDSQKYVIFSSDWNSDSARGTDQYGNPYQIPYDLTLLTLD